MPSINLALDCQEFDDYLVDTYQDCILDYIGIHYIFRFPNGYGASVVKSFGSIGYMSNMWELSVIIFDKPNILGSGSYRLAYPYSIVKNNGVLGPLTDDDVKEYLRKIKEL